MFGLCEERVSSVWVFLPLPPVYTAHTVSRGARTVGSCRAGKHSHTHTFYTVFQEAITAAGEKKTYLNKITWYNDIHLNNDVSGTF